MPCAQPFIHFRAAAHVRVQGKDQETNTEAESTDDDEEPGVTSHEVSQCTTLRTVG